MASYFSNLLTTTTSRVATLRQNLLASENDGDVEEDTHLCRVLRAYHIENKRRFPDWLPADPRAPPPQTAEKAVYATYTEPVYGDDSEPNDVHDKFSALFKPKQQQQWQQHPAQQARGRGRAVGAQSPNYQQQAVSPAVIPRDLPSRREGSQQAIGISAKDKLKGRYARNSSTTGQLQQGYAPPPSSGGSNYEDQLKPAGNVYGRQRSNRDDQPFMSATNPWQSNEREFGGGGYDGAGEGRQVGRRGFPNGLPSRPDRYQ